MKAALLALAMLAAPVVALAQGNGQGNAYAYGHEKQGDGGTVSVPEIDPTAITGPLALLATGTLILTDRLRRKQPCRK
jgi:hypothetical protein